MVWAGCLVAWEAQAVVGPPQAWGVAIQVALSKVPDMVKPHFLLGKAEYMPTLQVAGRIGVTWLQGPGPRRCSVDGA